MRFENWDVLLFPEDSRVPIQEFKTQCFVTKDFETSYLQSQSLLNPSALLYPNSQASPGQIPILTSFVPSQPRNSPFRVSVHCWDKPTPTKAAESLMQPDDSLLYEVRVFIDGQCVSGNLVPQRATWPLVIEHSSEIDRNGNQDVLRFPPFHEELLQDCRWDASETYGRIRVVLSEGLSRPRRTPPFERVRDILIFSFQHAPLQVLEYANIAWPNPGMWQQARHTLKYNIAPGSKDEEDTHAHSPSRSRIAVPTQANYAPWIHRQYQTPPLFPDPFVDNTYREPIGAGFRQKRSTLDDVSMPDYSSSNSSRAISSMTGVSYVHSKQASIASMTAPPDDEQYNQLIEALSPKKHTSGTHAPTNTPSSVPSAPPIVPKPSAAAEARRASLPRSGPLMEVSQPASRRITSGSSVKSMSSAKGVSFEADEKSGDENASAPMPLLSPSLHVKGKKEGQARKQRSSEAGSLSPNVEVKKASPVVEGRRQKSSEAGLGSEASPRERSRSVSAASSKAE